jgi:hypothetical protein
MQVDGTMPALKEHLHEVPGGSSSSGIGVDAKAGVSATSSERLLYQPKQKDAAEVAAGPTARAIVTRDDLRNGLRGSVPKTNQTRGSRILLDRRGDRLLVAGADRPTATESCVMQVLLQVLCHPGSSKSLKVGLVLIPGGQPITHFPAFLRSFPNFLE